MEKRGQQNKQKDKTTAVLVWLLAILVMAGIVAGGLYAREYLHRSFLAVAVEQPDPKRNEHVVRVTPSPRTQDRTAAPVETTPTPVPVPTPTPSPVPTEKPTPTPTLNPLNGDVIGTGMRSPIVLDIQIRLMSLEYLDFEQPEDIYGAGVASAIAIFQRRSGLPETGMCDEETFIKLNDENAALYAVLPGDRG
ncbi:MAG: peptidoglycan-binding protein, partial [Clostridia bacterium]|nr:peptidoglycan-binding protein [Clostridia bacterium]